LNKHETLQDRMLRLLTEAGVDPFAIPIDGPIDHYGYAVVREPTEVVENHIVTDWHLWDPTVPRELIDEIVASFDEYQEARNGPVGRARQENA
jgi:hypothetical protein